MIAKARSMSKRKVNIIRGEIEHKRLKKQKLEKLLPKPDGHVEEEIGNDCTWGVLYFILREFVNRSLTPVKGRSLTPLRHRAHGPLSHFESNSCTGPMSRILNPFMRRSLTLYMGGLPRIFLMDPCHISRRGVALLDGQSLLQCPSCNRTPPGPLRMGELIGVDRSNITALEREAGHFVQIYTKRRDEVGHKFVRIRGLPEHVDTWATKLLKEYRGRKIKSKVVYGSTILIMTAMTIAAIVNSMVIINILPIKAAPGCPRCLEPPGDIEEARGGPEFVFTPLFDSLFQFYFPPTVWLP